MQFFKIDHFSVPDNMPFAYFTLIIIYVIRKELGYWLDEVQKKRKGELFIISWWLAMLPMFIIEFATEGKYVVPWKMVETCVLILMPYCLNLISKVLYKKYVRRQSDVILRNKPVTHNHKPKSHMAA